MASPLLTVQKDGCKYNFMCIQGLIRKMGFLLPYNFTWRLSRKRKERAFVGESYETSKAVRVLKILFLSFHLLCSRSESSLWTFWKPRKKGANLKKEGEEGSWVGGGSYNNHIIFFILLSCFCCRCSLVWKRKKKECGPSCWDVVSQRRRRRCPKVSCAYNL